MNKKFNILIRTSGGKAPKMELGFGHIFRTCNLAKFLKSQHMYFLVEDFGGAEKIIKQHGFPKVKKLKKTISLYDDISKTKSFVKKNNIDLVIVDRYKLKSRYVSELSKIVKVVVISDLRNIDYKADAVINGFIGYDNQIILNKFNSKCYLGPKYQILNSDFSKFSSKKKTIFLIATFGGFDENKIIPILLKCLSTLIPKISTKIILGPGTTLSTQIQNYKKILGKNLILVKKTDKMFNEINNAKFGLCSGGITSYEFASCNIQFGIISQVRHQLITATEWEKKGFAKNLGIVNKQTEQKILNFLHTVCSEKYTFPSMSLVDGNGTKRASKIIFSLLK